MIEPKPKSIQTVGLIVVIISSFTIVANSGGFLVASLFPLKFKSVGQNVNLLAIIFAHYRQMCLMMITIGVLYLVSGLYLRKFKLWANRLMTIVSVILILVIWSSMIAVYLAVLKIHEIRLFGLFAIFSAVIWSVPIILLIRFLNKNRIKSFFE